MRRLVLDVDLAESLALAVVAVAVDLAVAAELEGINPAGRDDGNSCSNTALSPSVRWLLMVKKGTRQSQNYATRRVFFTFGSETRVTCISRRLPSHCPLSCNKECIGLNRVSQ